MVKNKIIQIGLAVMMVLIALEAVIAEVNAEYILKDGSETGVLSDIPWTSEQIAKITITEYIGKSENGYTFYKAIDPTGKIGALRVPPGNRELSFAFGDIGASNLKGYLDQNAFHDIEIDGSTSGWTTTFTLGIVQDDDLTPADLSNTYLALNRQITANTPTPSGTAPTTPSTTVKSLTDPISSTLLFSETSEDDISWSFDDINSKIAIEQNGYIGSSGGWEFYTGNSPDGKGIYRINRQSDWAGTHEVSFAEYTGQINTNNRDDVLALLLSSEKFHDIDIEGSQPWFWANDNLVFSDLSGYGTSTNPLITQFDTAKRSAAQYSITATSGLTKLGVKEGDTIYVRDVGGKIEYWSNGQWVQSDITSIDDATKAWAKEGTNYQKIEKTTPPPSQPGVAAPTVQQPGGAAQPTGTGTTTPPGGIPAIPRPDGRIPVYDNGKIVGYVDGISPAVELTLYNDKGEAIGNYNQLDGKYTSGGAVTGTSVQGGINTIPPKPGTGGSSTGGAVIPSKPEEKTIDSVAAPITIGGKPGTLDIPTEIANSLGVDVATKNWGKIEWATENEIKIKGDEGIWTKSSDGMTWTRKQGDNVVEEYRYSTAGNVRYLSSGTSQFNPKGGTSIPLAASFAQGASIDDKGKLVLFGKTYDSSSLSSDGTILTTENGKIIATKDGRMEVDKENSKVTVYSGDKKQAELDAAAYKALTNGDIKDIGSLSPDARNNLGAISKALKDQGITLTDIKKGTEEGTYWKDGMVITVKGTETTITKGTTDKDGKIDASKSYTTTTSVNGKITEIKDISVVGSEKKETTTKYDNTARTITIESGGKTMSLSMDPEKSGNFEGMYQVQGVNVGKDNSNVYFNGYEFYKFEDGKIQTLSKEDMDKIGLSADTLKSSVDAKRTEQGMDKLPTRTQAQVQQFWEFLESAARGGLGRFFSLFMEDEDLEEWRDSVDEFMCDTVILGGSDCWTSTICGEWIDNRLGDSGVYVETPDGMLTLAAHIEGQKTVVESPEGTQYLYKVTYVVSNPDEEELGFNIYFYGARTINLYSPDIILNEGNSSSRVGSSAIVQYSNYNYNKVCIEFSRKVDSAGDKVESLCNVITEYGGPATGTGILTEESTMVPGTVVTQNQI